MKMKSGHITSFQCSMRPVAYSYHLIRWCLTIVLGACKPLHQLDSLEYTAMWTIWSVTSVDLEFKKRVEEIHVGGLYSDRQVSVQIILSGSLDSTRTSIFLSLFLTF